MVDNTIIFNMADPIDLKRIAVLIGENLDSKIKHLGIGKCLIYDKIERSTYIVDQPDSPSAGSTPKLGETFEPISVMPLNPKIKELLE